MTDSALVLMYHAIVENASGRDKFDPQDAAYAITRKEFEQHLACIAAAQTVTLLGPDEVFDGERKESGSGLSVCLTFDDSLPHHAEVALPVLSERHARAAVFVSSDQLDKPGGMSSGQLRELAGNGWVIGSHGRTHEFLSHLSPERLKDDLARSKERLEDISGADCRWLSLPGGRGGRQVTEEAARLGYARIFGSRPGIWRVGDKASEIPRFAVRREDGTEMLKTLLESPPSTARRLALRSWGLRTLRSLMGDRLYHRLHNAYFRTER